MFFFVLDKTLTLTIEGNESEFKFEFRVSETYLQLGGWIGTRRETVREDVFRESGAS